MHQEVCKNAVIYIQISLLLLLFVGQATSQTFEPIPGYGCNGTEIITDTPAFCGLQRSLNCSGVITNQFYFSHCTSFVGDAQCRTFGDTYTIDTCNDFLCSRGATCGNNTYCRTYQITPQSVGCLHNGSCVAENALFSGIFPDCKTYRCDREITFDVGEPTTVADLCSYGGQCRDAGFQYVENCTTFNCSTSGSFNEIAKECSLPNGTCIPDGTNTTSVSPCESYSCTVTDNGTLTATLETVQGCDAFGSCYQKNEEFQDPSNACVKYVCNGVSWSYTETGCLLPNGTCIGEGTTVSTDPCASYVCTINTTVASAVTTNLETTPGCNVSGVCYQYNQTFDDSTDTCIKYVCNGSDSWYFTETGCSLPNGTCINGGDVVSSTSPCERYDCTVDTSSVSAVTSTLQTTTGCEAFGTCYQETDTFQDPSNTCINYTCNGNNSWAYTDAGCQLQNGSCIADGTTYSTTSPCETNTCNVNTSNPAMVTANLQTVPGCEVYGMCYQSMVEFQDPNNTCIRYICNGSNVWSYTQAGCLLPDGSCVNDSDVVTSTSPCETYTCSVDTSDSSSVTTNVETVTGCNVSGVCYQNQDVFNDTTEDCITYRCNGSNTWYYIDTGCSLANGTCIDNGVTVTSVTPCETNTCVVDTTTPSSVTATLQTNQGCEVFGMCYQATDAFNDPNNTCITYVCNGNNSWTFTQAECQLPNGTNCIANGSNSTSTNPCESYSCSVNTDNPSSVVATLQTTPGCEVYGMCYHEMDTFEDPNNTCIKYICNGNSGWTYTEAGCKLPNGTCIQNNENATSSTPCEGYSCSVDTSNPSSVTSNLETLAGCNVFGMCYQANNVFQDPSNSCIKYICNGGNNWTYTEVGCMLPNLTCISDGTVVSTSPCATYVCTVDTTNPSSVTGDLQTTPGCNVAGTCHQAQDVFDDAIDSCVKYICNGSDVWHYIDTGCSLPNGTCIESGTTTSNTPCESHICVLDTSIPSAVLAVLVTEPGCEMFGMCYQFGTAFEDPSNRCNIYVCTTGSSVISIFRGCLLPSNICVNHGYYSESTNPCVSYNCTVNATIPVTSNLETITGCTVGGNCYRPGEAFSLVQPSCIEYICTGNNIWTYTKAECIHPNGTCIPAGNSENLAVCEEYQCNVTTSNPSSVTAELDITEGCQAFGVCYQTNNAFQDPSNACIKYICNGGNNWTYTEVGCMLPNLTCISDGTVVSTSPCATYVCTVDTTNPSSVTANLQTTPVLEFVLSSKGCNVAGTCHQAQDVFDDATDSCIKYICNGSDVWHYIDTGCSLPNGTCIESGITVSNTPCVSHICVLDTSIPSAVLAVLVTEPGCEMFEMCYQFGTAFEDPSNRCNLYVCTTGGNVISITKGCLLPNNLCVSDGYYSQTTNPCVSYNCTVNETIPVTSNLETIAGCSVGGNCYKPGESFKLVQPSCIEYICTGNNSWTYTKAECIHPNGTCIPAGDSENQAVCEKYQCNVTTSNPSSVTAELEITEGCIVGGICYYVNEIYTDINYPCVKYRCLGGNNRTIVQAQCSLPNGTCIDDGTTIKSLDPCVKYHCAIDTSNPPAVIPVLTITLGCSVGGNCYCPGEVFNEVNNSCIMYECKGNNSWMYTKAECKLPNGLCLPDGHNAPHPDPCKEYHCHVNTSDPSAVTTELQIVKGPGCLYGGVCYPQGHIFPDLANPCIKYICLGYDFWKFVMAGCLLNGNCLADGQNAPHPDPCKKYLCQVDSSNPSAVTTNLQVINVGGCTYNGQCYLIGTVFDDAVDSCIKYRCVGINIWIFIKAECKLPNGLCLAHNQFAPHPNPCKKYHCQVDTTNPSAVTSNVLVIVFGHCNYGGVCYAIGAIFNDLANSCIKYRCLAANSWRFTQTGCKLPNGQCIADGAKAPHPIPCREFLCKVDATNPMAVTTNLQVINAGCVYNGRCYAVGAIFPDAANPCVTYICNGVNIWTFTKAECELPSGQCLAANQFAPHPDPCKKFHCHVDTTNPSAVTTSLQVVIMADCIYGGRCYQTGDIFSHTNNTCVEYRCLGNNTWNYTKTGCKLPNGQCLEDEGFATSADNCKRYHCHVDESNPMDVKADLQTTNLCPDERCRTGCLDRRNRCRRVGAIFRENCHTRRCTAVGRIVTVVLRCRHRRRCYRVGRAWNFKRRNGRCIRIRCRRAGPNRTRKIRRRICKDRRGRCRRIGARNFSAIVNGRLRRRCTCLRRGRNRVRYRCRR